MADSADDKRWMARALELARKGGGATSPNPMVGAVVVRGGELLGEGWHRRCGGLHAEREALADCARRGHDAAGATMYVTLEPCCHTGRQPPCTDAIVAAGIARVVVGCEDPNPLVAGKGAQTLRGHGIRVDGGVLEARCKRLNEAFFHFITTGEPFVTLKFACTLDGKTASAAGASKWITGEAARAHARQVRARMPAIMVGAGTVATDDPRLTARIEGMPDPLRIVCDTHLRTPIDAAVVRTARETPTLIATCERDPARHEPYERAGCEVVALPERGGHVDLAALMRLLAGRGVDGVLLEGGGTLAWSALEAGIVDRVQAYVAPMLMGGAAAKTSVGGAGFPSPLAAAHLGPLDFRRLGDDVLIEADVLRGDTAQAPARGDAPKAGDR